MIAIFKRHAQELSTPDNVGLDGPFISTLTDKLSNNLAQKYKYKKDVI